MPSDERSRLGASGFRIRELNEADLSLIADLTRRAFSTPHVPSPGLPAPGATHETREGIVKELRAGTRVFVLYLGPGTGQDGNGLGPAGIVRVTPRPPDAWVLSRFGVLPEFRGRGAGTLLLSSIEKQARGTSPRPILSAAWFQGDRHRAAHRETPHRRHNGEGHRARQLQRELRGLPYPCHPRYSGRGRHP